MPAMSPALVNDGLSTLRLAAIGGDLILRPKAAAFPAYRVGSLDRNGFVPEGTITWLFALDNERAAKGSAR